MKREQYISLKLRGRADNQSDFIEQKKVCILLRVGGPDYTTPNCRRSTFFYEVGTQTGANVHFGISRPTQLRSTLHSCSANPSPRIPLPESLSIGAVNRCTGS
jgi:hypothetical protein